MGPPENAGHKTAAKAPGDGVDPQPPAAQPAVASDEAAAARVGDRVGHIGSRPVAAETVPDPPIADGVEHRLDPRIVPLQRTVGWIVWAFLSVPLLAVAAGIAFGARPRVWVSLLLCGVAGLVSALLAWSAHAWPGIEHHHASYKVDQAGIEIRRGVLWRRIVNVARSRVQHTDVSQGPLERGYGLATLLIYTAGTDHAQVDLHGLDHATALRIRDHLLPGRSDDAV